MVKPPSAPVRPPRPQPFPVCVFLANLLAAVTVAASMVIDTYADTPALNLIYMPESMPIVAIGFAGALCLAIAAKVRREAAMWTLPAVIGVVLLVWLILGSGFVGLIALFSSTRK